MSKYVPDKWVIVRFQSEYGTIDKIMGGWVGGYCGSDRWKLSSGIIGTEITPEEKLIIFNNISGSKYVCYENCEGMSNYMIQIFNRWVDEIKNSNLENTSAKLILYKDWVTLYV